MKRKVVSLSGELWTILRAVLGARLLAESLSQPPVSQREASRCASSIAAGLTLIEARLIALDRVVSDSVDPASIWDDANDAGADDSSPDVRLPEWSTKHAVRKARDEYRRARRHHESDKRRRRSPS